MRRFLDDGVSRFPARAILTDDPMRAKMLVAHHLDSAVLISEQRGMVAYAGEYNGVPVGVFSVGYGQAAALMYLRELVDGGVDKLVYVGECVSLSRRVALRDIVLATSATGARGEQAAQQTLLVTAVAAAAKLNLQVHCLPVHTEDLFFLDIATDFCGKGEIVDFVSNAILWYAQSKGVSALPILTVSEESISKRRVEDAQRQSRFYGAARLAFETLGA